MLGNFLGGCRCSLLALGDRGRRCSLLALGDRRCSLLAFEGCRCGLGLDARSSCVAGAVDYVRAVVGAAVPRAAYCASDHAADDKDDDDNNRGDPTSRAVPRGLLRDATTVLRQPFFAREGNGSRAVVIRDSGLPVWRIGRSAIAAFIQQTDVQVVAPLSNREGGVNRVCRGLSEVMEEGTGSRGRGREDQP